MTMNPEPYAQSVPGWLRWLWLIPLPLALVFEVMLMRSTHGFPLDDAYIYYRYIENILAGQRLSFNPGEVSFGVTSFLYTVLSAGVAWLPWIDIIDAMQIVGAAAYLGLIYLGQNLVYRETGNLAASLFAGLMLALCRPLYFTGPAGLETMLFHCLAVGTLFLLLRRPRVSPVWIGAMLGLVFLTRPEGLMIAVGVAFFGVLYSLLYWHRGFRSHWKPAWLDLGIMAVGFAFTVLPYLIYVKIHSGFWMPSTFYGKLIARNEFTLWPMEKRIREGFFALLDGYREIIRQDTTQATFVLLLAGSLLAVAVFIFRSGAQAPSPRRFAAWSTFFCFFGFPFLFGFQFHTPALFGGYFLRYIQIIFVMMIVAGIMGLAQLVWYIVGLVAPQRWRVMAANVAVGLIALPWAAIIAVEALQRLPQDIDFYTLHAETKQELRMEAARWIRENTPPDSRILVGRTGLGVIGAFSDRYCKDEGGLMNPDIYPYLKKYPSGFHWESMLAYMKRYQLDYYTSYRNMPAETPVTKPTRFTKRVASFSSPVLENNDDLRAISRIDIYQFLPQARYDLWQDAHTHAAFMDPETETALGPDDEQIAITHWQDEPVIAMQPRPLGLEMRFDLILPDEAVLRSGLAVDAAQRSYGENETVDFRVAIQHEHTQTELHAERIALGSIPPRKRVRTIAVNLQDYSGRYGTLILSARLNSSVPGERLWAGWVEPVVASAAPASATEEVQ